MDDIDTFDRFARGYDSVTPGTDAPALLTGLATPVGRSSGYWTSRAGPVAASGLWRPSVALSWTPPPDGTSSPRARPRRDFRRRRATAAARRLRRPGPARRRVPQPAGSQRGLRRGHASTRSGVRPRRGGLRPDHGPWTGTRRRRAPRRVRIPLRSAGAGRRPIRRRRDGSDRCRRGLWLVVAGAREREESRERAVES